MATISRTLFRSLNGANICLICPKKTCQGLKLYFNAVSLSVCVSSLQSHSGDLLLRIGVCRGATSVVCGSFVR